MSKRLAVAGLAVAVLCAGCASAPVAPQAAASTDEGPVTCRQTLVPGSNVVDEVCLTAEGWKRYEKARRDNAQALVQRMQGQPGAGY